MENSYKNAIFFKWRQMYARIILLSAFLLMRINHVKKSLLEDYDILHIFW
jgi:hypothetical protein